MVDIKNSDDLREWLKGKPREYSVVIASRVALRVLPLVRQEFDAGISIEQSAGLIIATLRANLLSWAVSKNYTNNNSENNAYNAYLALFSATTSGKTIALTIAYAARIASKGYDAYLLTSHIVGFRADISKITSNPDTVSVVSQSLIAEVNLLEQGKLPDELIKEPLWYDADRGNLVKEWQELKKNLLSLNQDWDVWIGWYEAILVGRNWAGLPDEAVERLAINIADQTDEWWQQEPALVNADIKKWVDVARAEFSKNYLQTAKEMASPQPIINENNKLDVTSKTKINEPIIEEGLHLLPERARRQVKNLLAAFEQKNVSPILKSSLKSYLDELDKGFDFEITYLGDNMAIIRAERDADIDKIWYDGGIKTAIDNLSAIHDDIQKHYPLDIEREEYIKKAPIDVKIFNDEKYKKALMQAVEDAQKAFDDGEATQEFLNAVKRHARQYKDIATLYDATPVPDISASPDDRIVPAKVKKRFLFQNAGFWGGVLGVAHKGLSIIYNAKKIFDFFNGGG